MSMTDPIADFLTRIRNALAARHEQVEVGGSKMKEQLARILSEEGYIESWESRVDGPKRTISLRLKYEPGGEGAIRGLQRVSKPGCRVYCGAKDIPVVYNGLGINIVSTSRGVLSGARARSENVGGEVLCNVW
jgi:small subunit ribosomal protein S8